MAICSCSQSLKSEIVTEVHKDEQTGSARREASRTRVTQVPVAMSSLCICQSSACGWPVVLCVPDMHA